MGLPASDSSSPPSSAVSFGLSPASVLFEGRWGRSLRLEERLDLLRRAAAAGDAPTVDPDLGRKRLAGWIGSAPFDDPVVWQSWLDAEGATEDEIETLLGLDPSWLEARAESPEWLAEVLAAYAEPDRGPFPWAPEADLERCPFLPFLDPLIHRAHDRLQAAARQIAKDFPQAPFEPLAAARCLTSHLPDFLSTMLHRPMVVELHVARLEERLEGETGEERFADFMAGICRPDGALEVLAQYPVLARQIVLRLRQWQEGAAEFLRHLAEDAATLSERFHDGRELGLLEVARGAVSDPHRGGRGVFLLGFDSGFRVVYKPKSMRIETAFQGLQKWINDQGFKPALRILEVLDRDDHGWMEFVDAAPCEDEAALHRFYRRQGGYLALLYVLEATDFHQENLIAAGEHPVPVDLETLMQPWVLGSSLHDLDGQPGAALRSSLLRSNLLPDKWWGDGETEGVDLSGLASQEGQLTPTPVLTTADLGTDNMRVERRRVEIPMAENRPRLVGQSEISLFDHREDLEAGFVAMYDLLLDVREELLAAGSPLDAFEGSEIRILFRQTATYGTLSLESFHPHVLGDDLNRRRLFDRLWNMSRRRPFHNRFLPTEVRDLEDGDIPLFTARAESRDVTSWDGRRFEDLLGQSGLDLVRNRLRGLGPSDRIRQSAVLRDSLDALLLGMEAQPRPSFHSQPRDTPPSRDELCDAASRLARRVVDRAFRGPDETLWLTLHHGEHQGWHLAPTGPDVYQGLPGIALALGYLGDLLGDPELETVARGALEAQRRQIELDPSMVQGLGGFNGWGGVIYVLTHLGTLWDDPALLDEAESYAGRLLQPIAEDTLLDWIAGSAGCAMALRGLDRVRPAAFLRQAVKACGDRLLATAEPHGDGVGWRMPLAGNRALAGLSHGAAGIALSLLHVEEVTGDARYRETALAGLTFERGLYEPERQNWPDLRAGAAEGLDAGHGHYMQAWCHGAPGIGLARVAGLPWLDDDAVRAEIETTVASTLAHGQGQNHCLCHGDTGNLELALEAGRALGRDDWTEQAGRSAGAVLDSMRRDGYLFGLPGNVETPGLMTGLSGVAYGLARLAEPERLPSLLTLAPPPSTGPWR